MKCLFRAAWIIGTLIVVTVAGSLLVPNVSKGPYPHAQEVIVKIWIHDSARNALIRFRTDCGRFPTTDEGLDALVQPPAGQIGWKGPYLAGGRVPLDTWGRPYHYRSPAVKSSADYDLWSDAGDTLGDKDDIMSWKK